MNELQRPAARAPDRPNASVPVRVAYVAGFGRSGSTLLGNLLGQLDGAVSVGELRHLWTRGIVESRRCGCGQPVPRCPLWSRVLADTGSVQAGAVVARAVAAEARTAAPLTMAAMLVPGRLGRPTLRGLDDYRQQVVGLYRALVDVTGARVVIDTSKAPGGAWLVDGSDGIDLRVIHLVRDPRATAYSWSRAKPITDGGTRARMVTLGPLHSSAQWLLRNAATRAAFAGAPDRYRLVRYEDLLASPRSELERLAAWLGLDGDLPLLDDHTAVLRPVHAIAGNPARDRTGVVTLGLDDEWMRRMSRRSRRVTGLVTLPARSTFGYGRSPATAGLGAGAASDPQGWPDAPGWARRVRRLRRQVQWMRTNGVARMVEEKNLHPTHRMGAYLARARWRSLHGVSPGAATPVWVLGVQRSGTNLLTRILSGSPEFAVFSENHHKAFADYRLRSDDAVRRLIARSRHRFVVFKPLCDSARGLDFWDTTFSPNPSRVIWAYRSVDGRVRSALSRFGDANLEVMRAVRDGRHEGMWQVQNLSDDDLDLVRSFDWGDDDAPSAAALFWYLRNKLIFELGLHRRPRVTVFSYDACVADPLASTAVLERFLGTRSLVMGTSAVRPSRPPRVELHPEIRLRCDELGSALDALWDAASRHPGGALVGVDAEVA